MKRIKIAFFDAKSYDMDFFDKENINFSFEIKYLQYRLSTETMFMANGFDVVCCFVNDVFDKDVIQYLHENGIKLIALRCAGYNNVDLKAAFGKTHICRVPAYSPYAVAEHAVALMMALNRKIHRAYFRTRDANFSISGFIGFDMHGKTAGIIGTGKIGKVLAGILKGFGMKVLLYDVNPDKQFSEENGFQYVNLDDLYKESDIISLHCPLTKDTTYLINEKSISIMKDGVMIINTGRGKLINTTALIEGLKIKKIAAAGLDVYEEEDDYFFEDYSNEVLLDDILARLLIFNNVIVTSHQAFLTKEALSNIANTTLNNIKDYFEKDSLPNEICYKCTSGICEKKIKGKCF